MSFSPISKLISNGQCLLKPFDDMGDMLPQKQMDFSYLRANIKPVVQDEFIPQACEDVVAVVDEYKPSILGVKAKGLRGIYEYAKALGVPNGTFQGKEFDEYVQKLNLNI